MPHNTRIKFLSFADRKVTIYHKSTKEEAFDVKIRETPRPHQYTLYCEYIMKTSHFPDGLSSRFVDHEGCTVILDGWGHPKFDWLSEPPDEIEEDDSVSCAPPVEVDENGVAIFHPLVAVYHPRNKIEREFEQYLKALDPEKILFSNRWT